MGKDVRPRTIHTLTQDDKNPIAGITCMRTGAGMTYALSRDGNSATADGNTAAFAHGLTIGADDTLRVLVDGTLKTITTHYVLSAGAVATISIGAGGTGYTVDDVLTVAQSGSGGNLTVTVTSVNAGVVDGVAIASAGTGYQIADGNAVTGGTGNDDCTIDVDTLVPSTSYVQFLAAEKPANEEVVTFEARTANAVVIAGGTVWFDVMERNTPVWDDIVPTTAAVVEVM